MSHQIKLKRLSEYTNKQISKLTKMDLRTLIYDNTTKTYKGLPLAQRKGLIELAIKLKKENKLKLKKAK